MEKLTQQSSETEEPINLEELLMELFPREFLENLPPAYIEEIIYNLREVESTFETVPPEWLALKNVLQERGFLEQYHIDGKVLVRPAQPFDSSLRSSLMAMASYKSDILNDEY